MKELIFRFLGICFSVTILFFIFYGISKLLKDNNSEIIEKNQVWVLENKPNPYNKLITDTVYILDVVDNKVLIKYCGDTTIWDIYLVKKNRILLNKNK